MATDIAATEEREYPVEFTGTAGEYFRIWIVNLALTIVTLGIYSAWAKVRRKRYFYGHTLLDGDAFEYRANPIAILKGRLIALGVVASIWLITHFAPAYFWVPLIAGIFLMPWLIVRSYAFNAYNSAFRNIRLHFHGTYGRALKLFVGYGLLTIVTLGIGYFWLKTRMTEFVIRHHSYGTTRFDVPDLKKSFFNVYGWMIGLGFLFGVTVAVLAGAVVAVTGRPEQNSPGAWAVNIYAYFGYLFIFSFVRARIVNATFNQATLGTVRFRSTLKVGKLFGIYLTNILAILATLGLATPWAIVRTLRYRADNTTVIAAGGLDRFVTDESAHVGAAGEEVGEMLDLDFGL